MLQADRMSTNAGTKLTSGDSSVPSLVEALQSLAHVSEDTKNTTEIGDSMAAEVTSTDVTALNTARDDVSLVPSDNEEDVPAVVWVWGSNAHGELSMANEKGSTNFTSPQIMKPLKVGI